MYAKKVSGERENQHASQHQSENWIRSGFLVVLWRLRYTGKKQKNGRHVSRRVLLTAVGIDASKLCCIWLLYIYDIYTAEHVVRNVYWCTTGGMFCTSGGWIRFLIFLKCTPEYYSKYCCTAACTFSAVRASMLLPSSLLGSSNGRFPSLGQIKPKGGHQHSLAPRKDMRTLQ